MRNEAQNLPALIESLKAQTYTRFEVLVVDDHSEDASAQIIQQAAPPFRLISLSEHIQPGEMAHKKKAIETGIAQAKGHIIVTTDGDCTVGSGWLSEIASFFALHRPDMLVMPVSIQAEGDLLSVFQALDFMMLQGITGAGLQSKLHHMNNGANLAYTKNIFNKVGGFSGINDLASGDDMLLLQKLVNDPAAKICYLKIPEVIVETKAAPTWSAFIDQRIRWAGKSNRYKEKSLLPVMLLVFAVNLFLLVFFTFLLAELFSQGPKTGHWVILLAFLAVKTFAELLLLIPVSKFFKQQWLLWAFPALQPLHIVYTVAAAFLAKAGRYEWKGRKLR